jgi:glycosyltransferase involved in cell wall biosynthesis
LAAWGGLIGPLVQRLCALIPEQAFCFSELHAQRLRNEGLRGRITVLRGLYTVPAESIAPQAVDPTALFAGRLIARARSRIEGLRAIFLGDGPDRGALEAAIADNHGQDVVSAPGFAAAEDVDMEMTRALCLLLPSRREGYGMVVVEPAARGTPSIVAAGEDNAATELIEEGVKGVIAERADAGSVADAIVLVHRAGLPMRESTARWFADNAEALSLKHSLETVLENYPRARA